MPTKLVSSWLVQLRQCFPLLDQIDVLDIVSHLFDKNIIFNAEFDRFSDNLRNAVETQAAKETRMMILKEISEHVPLPDFLMILIELEYHVEAIAMQIQIGRTTDGWHLVAHSQKLYLNLKQQTHNNAFNGSPTVRLNELYKRLKCEFDQCKTNSGAQAKLQRLANNCVACLFAALDAEITLWKSTFSWTEKPIEGNRLSELLHEVNGFRSYVSNVNILETGLYSRVAIAYAMSNQLSNAEEYIKNAFMASLHIPVCAELVFMFNMYIMILLFRMEPLNPILFNKLKDVVNKALKSLEEERDENVHHFWYRMISLRYVFFLLGLKNNLQISNGTDVTKENIRDAKSILENIGRMGEMEDRRMMFKFAAKARIHELEGKYQIAIKFAKMGINRDSNNCFGETINLHLYVDKLKEKGQLQDRLHSMCRNEPDADFETTTPKSSSYQCST